MKKKGLTGALQIDFTQFPATPAQKAQPPLTSAVISPASRPVFLGTVWNRQMFSVKPLTLLTPVLNRSSPSRVTISLGQSVDAVFPQKTSPPHWKQPGSAEAQPLRRPDPLLSQSSWVDAGTILPSCSGTTAASSSRILPAVRTVEHLFYKEEDRMEIIHSSNYTHSARTRTFSQQRNTS